MGLYIVRCPLSNRSLAAEEETGSSLPKRSVSHMQESDCPDLKLIARGKVRDLYEIDGGKYILFVATDRIRYFGGNSSPMHQLNQC